MVRPPFFLSYHVPATLVNRQAQILGVYSSNSQRTRTARNTMKKRLLSVLLLLALALSLLPTTALAGNDLTGFTDAASISSDALPAMQWAVAQAIIRGDSFRLNPQSGATRASACAMLHRFFVT